MNEQEQRIAIAEACGWYRLEPDLENPIWAPKGWVKGRDVFGKLAYGNCHLPDYPNDLNAMHEAEKTLNDQQFFSYHSNLVEVILGTTSRLINATARQRAEAFLRTIGKWKKA